MSRRPVLLLAALLALCAAVRAQDAAARARQAAQLLPEGRYEELAGQFSLQMKQAAPPEKLRQAVEPQLRALGAVRTTGEPQTGRLGAYETALVPVEFEKGRLQLQFTFTQAGEIAGLFLRPPGFTLTPAPAWQRPAYSRPDSFEERMVTAGAPGWPLPATLAMPRGQGPFPGVVLVHGSGPHDRDETVGAAKPFRDLAEGLASCGVAVLRYEKRTREHAGKLAEAGLTLREEAIEDALTALQLLRKTPGIDPERVFLLGHSLGAWAAPLVAQEDRRLRGVILMAAPARPLEQLYVEQMRYLLSADPAAGEAAKARLAEAEREAEAARRIRETGEGPERALGAPRA